MTVRETLTQTHKHTESHSPFPCAQVDDDESLVFIGVDVVKEVES